MMTDQSRILTGYPVPNSNSNSNSNPNLFSHPPCSAHPYAVPLPQTYTYTTQHGTFLRRIFGIMITTVIMVATISFIMWLVLRPHLPQFRVDAFSLTSPFNLTFGRLSTSYDFAFTARNPNGKITLYYDHVQASVFYRGDSLADAYLAPFVQGTRVKSQVKSSLVVVDRVVGRDIVVRMHEEMGRGEGNVGFSIRIVADVRFKAGIWRPRRRLMRVHCGDLVVSVKGDGNRRSGLSGGPRQCSVG